MDSLIRVIHVLVEGVHFECREKIRTIASDLLLQSSPSKGLLLHHSASGHVNSTSHWVVPVVVALPVYSFCPVWRVSLRFCWFVRWSTHQPNIFAVVIRKIGFCNSNRFSSFGSIQFVEQHSAVLLVSAHILVRHQHLFLVHIFENAIDLKIVDIFKFKVSMLYLNHDFTSQGIFFFFKFFHFRTPL